MELLKVDSVTEARAKIFALAQPLFRRVETVSLKEARDRVLAADMVATDNVPGFTRSTVDGYAVLAADTAGAGENIPTVLQLVGAVEMGQPATFTTSDSLTHGQCVSVPTGGMLPNGADAMVMVEQSEEFGEKKIGIYSAVAPGENVIHAGDDMRAGDTILFAKTRLRAQEIGALAAAGITAIPVFSAPKMSILSTGDELVDPAQSPGPAQIRDINTVALKAQAEAVGYQVVETRVLKDLEDLLLAEVLKLRTDCDIVVVSGGSSQGEKDATARVIEAAADLGVLTHGLALKPGKPTITGFDMATQTLLIGLPGHPLSAMMVFEILLAWLLNEATGSTQPLPIPAILAHNVATAPGKDTLQLVSLSQIAECEGQFIAQPIHTKSGLISKLVQADGYLWIDHNTEGLQAKDKVTVHRFTM